MRLQVDRVVASLEELSFSTARVCSKPNTQRGAATVDALGCARAAGADKRREGCAGTPELYFTVQRRSVVKIEQDYRVFSRIMQAECLDQTPRP